MTTQRAMLVKIGEKQWMDDLVEKGRLRLTKPRTYAKYETNLVIGDPNEITRWRYPRENPTVKISARIGKFAPLYLPGSSINVFGPERDHGVYCMTAVAPVVVEGGLDCPKTIEPVLKNARFREFGNVGTLFLFSDQFVERLCQAAKAAGYPLIHVGVRYVPLGHTGEMSPFCKVETYAYQQEYRFLTDRPIPEEHLYLNLGPLNDIAGQFLLD